jgi:uncharacterized protein (DUF488 family)
MEIKRTYTLSKRKTSKNATLAAEIAKWLHAESSYTLIMKLIKEKGWQFVFEVYQDMKKRGVCNKTYFFGAALKQKILWK